MTAYCVAVEPRRLTIGPHFSEGTRLLWEEIEKRGGNVSTVRKILDMPRDRMSRLLYGDRRVTFDQSQKCMSLLGIPTDSWWEKPKSKFELPAVRRVREVCAPQASAAL
jgi:plasmid maintenance system antidote protein VapI